MEIRTVTVSRLREGLVINGDSFEDITVAFALREGQWVVTDALDEGGASVELNTDEQHLAQCLVDAGVDETGR
tara:strand:- start:244 stop:462 length:219 start_codon:yes stop_codon:yes gene_type:complete